MGTGPESIEAIVVGSIIIVVLGAVIVVGGAMHDQAIYSLSTTLGFQEPYLSMVNSVLKTAGLFYPVCILGIIITIAWVGKVVLFDAGYTGEEDYDYRYR